MKPEELSNAMGEIDDELIASADKKRKAGKEKGQRRRFMGAVAAAACLCLVMIGVMGNQSTKTVHAAAIAEAQYPEMPQYPNEMEYFSKITNEFDDEGFSKVYDAWWEARRAQLDQPEGYADNLDGFFRKSIAEFLSDAAGENRVCSPVNVYMALSMLAELTDGESRSQILTLLGAESMEALRTQAASVWNANYCKDGAVTSVLANSLWLNENIAFRQSTMDTLAKSYYASSYQGEMGSAEFNKALQDWLNEQTGGLLEEQAGQLGMDQDTILALASTIYFQAKWHNTFSEGNTTEGSFHGPGGDLTCEFMHQSDSRTYFWGEKFAAVNQRLEGSGGMWLILPDEGVDVEALLTDEETMDLVLSKEEWENSKYLIVNLAMPKFDVVSDISLSEGLQNLGITDVFDGAVSDFSPMTTDIEEIFVSQASHAARVTVDEEGCTAVAYTVMMAAGAGMPPEEEVDFVLDRPFLFVITGASGMPLFVGIVNQP